MRVPTSEHLYEWDFELDRREFLPHRTGSVLEDRVGQREPCAVNLSDPDFLGIPASLSAKQATHEGKDKRRDHRFETYDDAVLQILNPFSDGYSKVHILDVSKNGLRLQVTTGVMPGSLLKVRMEHYVAFGDARYCMPAPEGFFVGVQLHDYVWRHSLPEEIRKQRKAV